MAAAAGLIGVAGLLAGASGANAASAWWERAPGPGRPFSQIASDSGFQTLAISRGTAGWIDPSRGLFQPVAPGQTAAYVAAHGSSGLVLDRAGELLQTRAGGRASPRQRLQGMPRGLAIGYGRRPLVVAVTSTELYLGRLGSRLSARDRPFRKFGPLALAAPVNAEEPFVIAVGDGMFFLRQTGRLTFSARAPHLGGHASLAELGDGVVLAGDRRGLLWGRFKGGWSATFQILPVGGLGGVPSLTSMAADGASAAYLGTSGFGTLLTPDAGYSWYSVPLPGSAADVVAMATLGPVFSAGARGLVVAATPSGLVLHRLQPLPAPPAYTGQRGRLELLATALVTAGSAAAVVLLLWLQKRRQRRRRFV